jgi:hypothetical protein
MRQVRGLFVVYGSGYRAVPECGVKYAASALRIRALLPMRSRSACAQRVRPIAILLGGEACGFHGGAQAVVGHGDVPLRGLDRGVA